MVSGSLAYADSALLTKMVGAVDFSSTNELLAIEREMVFIRGAAVQGGLDVP
jgi:hypothetical protein